jgi:hypothetical protein
MCNEKDHPPQIIHLPYLDESDSSPPKPHSPSPPPKPSSSVKRRSPSLPSSPQPPAPPRLPKQEKSRIEIPIVRKKEVPIVRNTNNFHYHYHERIQPAHRMIHSERVVRRRREKHVKQTVFDFHENLLKQNDRNNLKILIFFSNYQFKIF